MRKDVTLGMTIGGGLLAVALVGVIAVSHKGNNRHGGVETLMNNGGAGDVGSSDAAAEQSTPKADEKSAPSKLQTEDKPAPVKPAPRDMQVAKADPKSDPVSRALFGGDVVPSLISTQTPDSSGTATTSGGGNEGAGDAQPAKSTADELPSHVGPGGTVIKQDKPTKQAGESRGIRSEPNERTANDPAPTPAAGGATVASNHTHKVQKGETFSTIAAAAYGSANYYPYIMRANPKVDAKALKPGMELALPYVAEVKGTGSAAEEKSATKGEKGEATPASHKAGPAPLDATKEYKVVAGDSLNKIAIRLYGKQDMTQKIYEANRSAIGENPAAIKVGMILKLPQPPVMASTTSAR
jgi:nucleoid-associated protein YgaU